MKKFLIKVNGNQYEVEVEEVKGVSAPAYTSAAPVQAAPAPAPAPAPTPAPALQPHKAAPAGSTDLSGYGSDAGTILNIVASVGDKVKRDKCC